MASPEPPRQGRGRVTGTLRQRLAVRQGIARRMVSLANLLGRPVVNDVGTTVGKVSDVVVQWSGTTPYPKVTGVLVTAGRGFGLVDVADVELSQTKVALRTAQVAVARPERSPGDVALARDVLDHQLVDLAGVQVVRAADVYLVDAPGGWELGGVDVGLRAFGRRLLPRRRHCPPPVRAVDWSELQSFTPRFADESLPRPEDPAAAAGQIGAAVRLSVPAARLNRLRAAEVAAVLAQLGRGEQAQVAALATSEAAAAALATLEPAQREALMAELSEPDRRRLMALLPPADPA
jgi:sporulation protein YlmC with PRC-barrel domain